MAISPGNWTRRRITAALKNELLTVIGAFDAPTVFGPLHAGGRGASAVPPCANEESPPDFLRCPEPDVH